MFEIIDSNEVKTFDEIENEYNGEIVLVKKADKPRTGTIYAISDFDEVKKLTRLQYDMHCNGIETTKVHTDKGISLGLTVEGKWLI